MPSLAIAMPCLARDLRLLRRDRLDGEAVGLGCHPMDLKNGQSPTSSVFADPRPTSVTDVGGDE
jgi:hypothetical protein